MRLHLFASLGVVSLTLVVAACSGGVEVAGTQGTGGDGGNTAATTTSTTVTSTTSGIVDAGPDVDNGKPSDVYPAPHPPPPEVVTYGGPVLAAPKFVPVFFSNDDAATVASMKDFASKIGATEYWKAATSEYGVGPGTSLAPIDLAETATGTIDDNQIQTWLLGKLNDNDPAWPAPDADTVYVLHYPAGVTITLQDQQGTAESCQSFGGYHNNVTLDAAHGSLDVAYAVLPRCSNFGDLQGLDALTGAESHELVEAATDPYPQVNPAYAQTDEAHLIWTFALGGGETGDMCAQLPGAFTTFPEIAYTVQRSWSNASAKAGHDPCVPTIPGQAYFNSAPVLNDDIILGFGGQKISMKGVKIPVGGSKTVEVDLFSDAPTGGPWDVEVMDSSGFMGGSKMLDLSLDRTSGQNGEKLHLTINVLKASPYKAEAFYVISKLNGQANIWVGLVGN
jgi:hypothetical protein